MSGVGRPQAEVVPTASGLMETMLEAAGRLRADGYRFDVSAVSNRRLLCSCCGGAAEAGAVAVERTVRFEGDSNPDDEQILLAVALPCGHRGLLSAAFGPMVGGDAGEVLRALPANRHHIDAR